MNTLASRKERRWIVLGDDGAHVTLGRHSDPSEAEIVATTEKLQSIGRSGWLAILEGSYYSHSPVSLLMVRQLVGSEATWELAVERFNARRRSATTFDKPTGPKPPSPSG